MITILLANPSLDRTLQLTQLEPGEPQRVSEVQETAGGKGLNVARVLRSLDTPSQVVAPLGGYSGRRVAELAAASGITAHWTRLPRRRTRVCTLVVESATGRATALNEAGPQLTARDWQRLIELPVVADAGLLLVCGSLPPGVATDGPAELVRARAANSAPTWVDTAGPALRAVLAAAPALVKVNDAELRGALQLEHADAAQCVAAYTQLAAGSAMTLIVTHGAAGAAAYRGRRRWRISTPPVRAASTIGCGDAFFAGLAAAAARGLALDEQLRWAAAAGAAEAVTALPGDVDDALAAALRREVVVSED